LTFADCAGTPPVDNALYRKRGPQRRLAVRAADGRQFVPSGEPKASAGEEGGQTGGDKSGIGGLGAAAERLAAGSRRPVPTGRRGTGIAVVRQLFRVRGRAVRPGAV